MNQKKYTLRELVIYFLKLGTWGFGGPVALVAYMHRDLVENRNWLSEEEYKEGLALSQLAPGPLAAQLGIYIGFVHYGLLGATLVGLAFILPSFLMVLALGVAYQLYSGLSWMREVFYGVSAGVIGIIAISAYKLTIKSLGNFNSGSFKNNWLLWIFYLTGVVLTVVRQREEILLFVLCGIIYLFYKSPPEWLKRPRTLGIFLFAGTGLLGIHDNKLFEIGIFFLKAGAFVFGSGLAIVPFLHAGLVVEYQWLSESQFIDSVAVAMITPGPVVITVGFIGYLIAGIPGACIAALATFLPCFMFTVILAPSFKKVSNNKSIKAFVDGITAVVIGSLLGAVIIIATRSIIDIPTALIAISAGLALFYIKKVQEPQIILFSAIIGILIKNFF